MKDLSMHIMDIIQNSVRAESTMVTLDIEEDPVSDRYWIVIGDNGCGMDKQTLANVMDPFFTTRTTRKVGLGLPLLRQNAERTGGEMILRSTKGKGTELEVWFTLSHLDRPVLGDIAGTMVLLVGANPEMNFVYTHKTPKGEYVFDTREVKQILEEVSIADPQIMSHIKTLINENIKSIIVS